MVKTKTIILNQGYKKIQTPLQKLITLFKFKVQLNKNHRLLQLKQEPLLKPHGERDIDLQGQA